MENSRREHFKHDIVIQNVNYFCPLAQFVSLCSVYLSNVL